MFIYYTLLDKEIAEFYECPQSTIAEGSGDALPWHRPSECIWMVLGTVDPKED